METVYVYPGSFCPPTYGHLALVRKALEVIDSVSELVILCSKNPDKDDQWFSENEVKDMWLAYDLPARTKIMTLAEFIPLTVGKQLVMVRGIRGQEDVEYEKQVMLFNREKFGIKNFIYIFCEDEHKEISSSLVRKLVEEMKLEELPRYVAPMVISKLLEKVLAVKRVYLVVGRPGAGKSTVLKKLVEIDERNVHINTDDFNKQLGPVLAEHFGQENLLKIALEREEELMAVIKRPWFKLLTQALWRVPKDSNVFVEIAYGLQADKALYRYLGGRIIYIGCDSVKEGEKRIEERGTPDHKAFWSKIPDLAESQVVARLNRLQLVDFETNFAWSELENRVKSFGGKLGSTDDGG